ncbi:MAG: bifunctional precorrin-2 dehydrogenase/sirohydrochlorin ferrochelatase [Dehalococcoidia bacterium]|nr:MAG: bifunctional precorrin-2 dehydrogenase/sirohydrochlorin ferrochelatase [Dehalococcoidia bacterium]
MPQYFPIYLDITRRSCVVVGGGEVALRKVQALLDCQAAVTVVSPVVCHGLLELSQKGDVKLILRKYKAGDLQGATLAIAATDERETNLQVSREAKERAVLVNIVDEPKSSDFIVPAYFHRGDITIAISTAGSSPALARKLRTRLESEFGLEYAVLVGLVNDVRLEIKRRGKTVDAENWQTALDLDSLLALIREGDEDGARRLLLNNLNALTGGQEP